MKTTDYGIDGPLVLLGLVIIGMVAVGFGVIAAFQILPIRPSFASAITKLSIFITAFNLVCILLSVWSSKIGKVREANRLLDTYTVREANRLLDTYTWNGNENVLDVGCGRGLMLISAAKRLITSLVVGVDIWDSRDQAGNRPENTFKNAQIEDVAGRVEIVDSDARQLPFENNTFDVVLSNKVFHNITNRKERKMAIQESARVLKPGGWLGIIDSFQYAVILTDIGWKNTQTSGRRFHMFPPVKWTTGIKPKAN